MSFPAATRLVCHLVTAWAFYRRNEERGLLTGLGKWSTALLTPAGLVIAFYFFTVSFDLLGHLWRCVARDKLDRNWGVPKQHGVGPPLVATLMLLASAFTNQYALDSSVLTNPSAFSFHEMMWSVNCGTPMNKCTLACHWNASCFRRVALLVWLKELSWWTCVLHWEYRGFNAWHLQWKAL